MCRHHHCTILVHPLNFQAVPTEATHKLGVEMWKSSIMVAENPRSVPITKREGIVTLAENARRSVPTWKHCCGGGERKKKRTNVKPFLWWRRTQEEAHQRESIVAVAENARRSVPTWNHSCGDGERLQKACQSILLLVFLKAGLFCSRFRILADVFFNRRDVASGEELWTTKWTRAGKDQRGDLGEGANDERGLWEFRWASRGFAVIWSFSMHYCLEQGYGGIPLPDLSGERFQVSIFECAFWYYLSLFFFVALNVGVACLAMPCVELSCSSFSCICLPRWCTRWN